MASAIIGGLIRQSWNPDRIHVIEPWEEQRQRLAHTWQVQACASTSTAELDRCQLVIWAIKPQSFLEAATQTLPYLHPEALHLSVAAGIRSDTIAQWLHTERIVRAMPNTPALVGLGMTGLFARAGISMAERQHVENILHPTGRILWVDEERQLDAVTALSGSGPAYVFYFLEAMTEAGTALGLSPTQAHELAVGTFVGAATLAQNSNEPPSVLRQRVTSKGGTTYAALTHLQDTKTGDHFKTAIHAAAQRAAELGDAFGK
ncbi:MAG: hypothetical protein RLZZ612_208 [Pseudomonadota bacterium]